MKRGMVLLLLVSGFGSTAQTFSEWFRQNSIQLRYLRQQVAALAAYIQTTEQGYKFLQQATEGIAGIKKMDLDLHRGYFNSLSTLKPAIRGAPPVEEIAVLYDRIVAMAGEAATRAPGQRIVLDFFRGLRDGCDKDVGWLHQLTTDGQLTMNDAGRVAAIGAVLDRMRERLANAIRAMNVILEMQLNGKL